MKEQQQRIIVNFVRAYNAFDVDGMTEDLRDDVVFENISENKRNMRTEGLDAFRAQATAALSYFNERKQQILSWHFQGEDVVIEIEYEAIPAVDLPNGMQAGATYKLKGRSVFTFRGEQIAWIRDII